MEQHMVKIMAGTTLMDLGQICNSCTASYYSDYMVYEWSYDEDGLEEHFLVECEL